MAINEVTVLQCSLCQKYYPKTSCGAEEAAACCKCPRCGADPSLFSSMFKTCRRCDETVKTEAARETLKRAQENLALHEQWLAEEGGPSAPLKTPETDTKGHPR